MDGFKWKKLATTTQSVYPEPGSFLIELCNGIGVSYGGQKTNVGGRGVISDFRHEVPSFAKTKRIEKKSDDLPYHNVEGAAGVLLGDDQTIFMWGGVDRFSAQYSNEGYKIVTTIKERASRFQGMEDFIIRQFIPEHDKIGGRFGHTLTLLDDGRVMLFGGKQRANWDSSNTANLYRDSTPEGLFILDTENLLWTEAIVDGDIPEGRAFHTTFKVGGQFFVIGGICVEGAEVQYPHSYLLTYDIISGTFHSTRIKSSINISHHSCNILNNVLILSGGLNNIDDTMNDKTYLIDIDDVNNMLTLQTGYANLDHHTLVVGSKLYTFGGRKNNKHNIWEFSRMNEAECEVVSDEDTGMSETGDAREVRENSEMVSGAEAIDHGVEQGEVEEEIVRGFVCFMQEQCVNVNASTSVKDILLSCMKCDQLYHLFCIGFCSNPFRSEEQQDNCLFYCTSCRATHRDELQKQMSSRQWRNLDKNLGIIKDHHLY